ncbi:para-nitrobenzyl esterase [Halopseudomonas xinjiangensis]|uniref:Carboxylic ester hydrolase n=1 Tax=Halopseudomonas xinjiangensis TaxID=487184 RepID=A0A1H1RHU7_9GAMM|nr:carboxylesterase family protein [Halopseudomonas xinjiangensis]SDS35265.1 para-nitrobenzyl esterase [Halopseudomonas xinjiangensis]
MNNNKSEMTKPRFFLTAISTAVLAVSLTGCLGGDSDNDTPPPAAADPLAVETQQGTVAGIELNNMRVFRGIPYGAEPERFAAPELPAERTERLVLSEEFATSCPQPDATFGDYSDNEDCLYLNVYAPPEPGDYPVMVWIHGGSLTTGSGGSSYEPARLVEQGIVVVTINYRLGALGFLPHSSLADENGSYGNYGLMDQQLALKWVEENISGFGGNPDNVTIFGESAGGHSVMSHLASPGSAGLFDKAIVQSGSYSPTQLSQPAGEAVFGQPLVAATGCDQSPDVATCLRELPVDAILDAQAGSYLPVTGGQVLPESIDERLSSGTFNQVPVMIGSNLHEGRLFVGIEILQTQTGVTAANYQDKVDALLASDPREYDRQTVADEYYQRIVALENIQPDDPGRYARALSAINTDWRFACSNVNQLQQINAAGQDAYGYWFTDENAPSILPYTVPGLPWGAAHAFEIQYVLADESTFVERGATESQVALSDAMVGYWANFAKFGDPNSTDGASGNVEWSAVGESGTILDLDPAQLGPVPATSYAEYHNCDLWADPETQAPLTP